MKYKYGNFSEEQMRDYKKILHNKIHWLLLYKESNYEKLDEYFENLQCQIAGLVSLFNSYQLINLANTIECARLESLKDNYNHKTYRKFVLDAHDIIDSLPEKDCDINE